LYNKLHIIECKHQFQQYGHCNQILIRNWCDFK